MKRLISLRMFSSGITLSDSEKHFISIVSAFFAASDGDCLGELGHSTAFRLQWKIFILLDLYIIMTVVL
ncbi:hypothetical protein TorRG33x02_020820 [Trema orientale]|uniref:Uncharacterized protein n=1 Tax=Trema orientale TaxID=63057 RepID=A0A2P5FWY3_TREOI|nr:hypothetical protein TorRG33x02_020820 [Trema orientale]